MPDVKITAMTALAAGAGVGADLLTLVDMTGPTNVKQTLTDFFVQVPVPIGLGNPATVTGSLFFYNANNANSISFTTDTPAASLSYVLPNASPTVGQVLRASAPALGVVTLSWVAQTALVTPAGANTQIQFNNGGAFGASANLTWVSPTLTIGAAASATGILTLANSGGATLTSVRAGNAASTLVFVLPVVDPTIGQVLSASAPAAGTVTLSWVAQTAATSPGGSTTQLQYNNAGAFGGISGATTNGTATTFTSANLLATSPRITTGINDANNAAIILFTATGTAVNQLTIANAAAGGEPSISATGTDTDINITLSPKGAGVLDVTEPLTLSGLTTTSYTTPQANSVPTVINVVNFTPAAFGQLLALGIPSAAPTNARVISALDARTVAHQPTIAAFAPDENNLCGFSWDGSNTICYVKSTAGIVGLQGRIIQGCPASAVTDGDLANSQFSIWANEGISTLTIRFRDSAGTLKTATLVYT